MKRRIKAFLLFVLILSAFALTGYLTLAFYYRESFVLNTWINGVYCTGKSVEEVNSELLSLTEAPIIAVIDKDGKTYFLDLGKAGFSMDYRESLEECLEDQNPYLWVDNIAADASHRLTPAVAFDEGKLRKLWQETDLVKQAENREETLELCLTEKGYALYDGLSDRLDIQKAYDMLLLAIRNGENQVVLTQEECYYDSSPTDEQKQLLELWKKIEAFQNSGIVYDMGDERVPVDAADAAGFLKTQEGLPMLDLSGELIVEKEKVEAFIKRLAEEYDTYGKERSFLSARGEWLTIEGGTYGTEIDQKAEVAYLMEGMLSGKKELHVPEYKRQGMHRGKDDIGDTYIEIDMTGQKMYYFEAGELLLETEVVTGNMSRGWGTPGGTYYVYNKQKNRILRGEGYASPVKYWMPVNGGIGIHDADWRKEFGGEIYKKSGSHGCINTPPEKMAELYDMVETGTPVVMYY